MTVIKKEFPFFYLRRCSLDPTVECKQKPAYRRIPQRSREPPEDTGCALDVIVLSLLIFIIIEKEINIFEQVFSELHWFWMRSIPSVRCFRKYSKTYLQVKLKQWYQATKTGCINRGACMTVSRPIRNINSKCVVRCALSFLLQRSPVGVFANLRENYSTKEYMIKSYSKQDVRVVKNKRA